MMRWYVVHTHPRDEKTAMVNLRRQDFTAFLPEYLQRRRHARRVDFVRAPLFPRYLFVAMDIAQTRWRSISSTLGVSHLICQGEMPAPVPQGIVEGIQARLDGDGYVSVEPKIPFQRGDVVQVVAGPLADTIGLFDCATDEDRVILLLDILGRRVKVKLPLTAVTAAA